MGCDERPVLSFPFQATRTEEQAAGSVKLNTWGLGAAIFYLTITNRALGKPFLEMLLDADRCM